MLNSDKVCTTILLPNAAKKLQELERSTHSFLHTIERGDFNYKCRYTIEKIVTGDCFPNLTHIFILDATKRRMLADTTARIYADRTQPSLNLRFNFSYRGNRRSDYGQIDRQTEFYPGFPDSDDWKVFGKDWQKWDAVIRLEVVEVQDAKT